MLRTSAIYVTLTSSNRAEKKTSPRKAWLYKRSPKSLYEESAEFEFPPPLLHSL